MRILHLTLHRKWFDEIASGIKVNEYRDIKPYWEKRLEGKTFDEIHFRNGYSKTAPFMRVKWSGIRKEKAKNRFNIILGKVLEVKY